MDIALNLPFAFLQPVEIILTALVLNLILCREALLARTFRTPMTALASAVNTLEHRYNRSDMTSSMRRADGWSTALTVVLMVLSGGYLLEILMTIAPYGWAAEAFIVATFLGQRAILDQMQIIIGSLKQGLEEARATIALFTGRETRHCDSSDLAKDGVEHAAMGLCEGVVAPLFYYMLFGLTGILFYKTINLAATMIHERSEDFEAFGQGFRRINALLNYIPARLSAILIALISFLFHMRGPILAMRSAMQEGRYCFRPSVGWAVGAMAGALNIRLGGDVVMEKKTLKGTIINKEGSTPAPKHLPDVSRLLVIIIFAIWILLTLGLVFEIWFPIEKWKEMARNIWVLLFA